MKDNCLYMPMEHTPAVTTRAHFDDLCFSAHQACLERGIPYAEPKNLKRQPFSNCYIGVSYSPNRSGFGPRQVVTGVHVDYYKKAG